MSNVLVLGVGPLPVDPAERLHAPGIRVWHLATVINKHHHSVVVGTIKFGDFQDNPDAVSLPKQESAGEGLTVCRFQYHSQRTPEALATLHERCQFDCVVATTDIMNDLAARIPVRLPLWLDYLGDPFAERQLQAATYDNDASLLDLWKLMLQALLHGDRFSVASTPQKYALLAQLALAGRLNQFTAGEDLISVIPNSSRVMKGLHIHRRSLVKGYLIPAESFLVLWAGGYNTWMDPETLFYGLEQAIRENPSIYFVSVGGEIPGHDNLTFKKFRALCDASEFHSHFLFLGWVPPDEVPHYYLQADAAINVDLPCYEAELGTRTRLVDWLEYEVPIVTTALCEPAKLLAEKKLIETFDPASPTGLARALLNVCEDHNQAKERARRAKAFFDSLFEEDMVFAPLLSWVERPTFASDRRIAVPWLKAARANTPLFPDSEISRRHLEWLEKVEPQVRAGVRKVRARSAWHRLLNRFRRR
ncbi:MAG: glycosyltransferase [Candidatus Sumerlaeaceae bacterium]|nr:glycosyltransferase [Candidatus Sumerlaeaceae bacterium]